MRRIVFAAMLSITSLSAIIDCRNSRSPGPVDTGGPGPVTAVEAGVTIAGGLCTLVEGLDDSGVLRNICASLEEIGQMVAFILTLRPVDAGVRASTECQNLPGTTFCATSAERAKAILFISKTRDRRLLLDAGR